MRDEIINIYYFQIINIYYFQEMTKRYVNMRLIEQSKKICPNSAVINTITDPTGFLTVPKRSMDPVWGDGYRERMKVHGYPRTERDKGEGYTTYERTY